MLIHLHAVTETSSLFSQSKLTPMIMYNTWALGQSTLGLNVFNCSPRVGAQLLHFADVINGAGGSLESNYTDQFTFTFKFHV